MAPSERPFARSSTIDTTITGIAVVSGSRLRAASTSQPLTSGSRMSRTTATGFMRRVASNPLGPSCALDTSKPALSR